MEKISQGEALERFPLKLLDSGGNYDLPVIVASPDELLALLSSTHWMDDGHLRAICECFPPDDLGTLIVEGDVRFEEGAVSDRLMCLVIFGTLKCDKLTVRGTEVAVFGDVTVGELEDSDEYLSAIEGQLSVTKSV